MNGKQLTHFDRPKFIKLLLASIIIALAISLGMVVIASLLSFSLDPVVPAITGVIGAAVFAARWRT